MKEYDEITSQSTKDGSYFNINFFGNDNSRAFNPSLLPHPQLFDTWIAVAQARYEDRSYPSGWSSELVCNAVFNKGGNLSCTEPPTVLVVPATQSTHCKDKLLTLHMNIGPHDARAFFGPEYPYLIYGTQSEHTCFGQWTQDFRLLMDWGIFRGYDAFQVPTEIQRPPPLGAMEKNYYFFWDFDKVLYAHYDSSPHRAFAKVELDGSAGPDLAPQVYAKDEACFNKHLRLNPLPDPKVTKSSIHQATNSLSLTLCNSTDTSCIPNADNTYIIAIYQHKIGNGLMHARYEPHVMVMKRRAPFEIHAITAKPLWIRGRKNKDEMIYITSMNYKQRGQTYTGYLDDIIHVNFGVEDRRTSSIDVKAGDLVRNLMFLDESEQFLRNACM
ncbi:hypothetical protein M409DRAFT_68008 [Zasmidium cellare ATCC 36951]|uniref:Uncharacterized protein n=1 Tax=Zasmidium cellare ATCC 36951 TaxID=1080233 RepID=A0A6A6CB92_ZASCE|nr:uncharacterized protein M409DRAFT_68008 [Zasmidium cellare ATCC 36951]KAF2164063.1 hypothetical protein M409DRAFT_68008 [Zasmidium cellare ATCC 36951]